MKEQCIPKFLKEELSKYVCILMKNKPLATWYRVTPYMTKFMMIYDNIPKKNIIQSYTAADVCLNWYTPRPSEMFVRKWFRKNRNHFYNDDIAKIYMDKYYPEGIE